MSARAVVDMMRDMLAAGATPEAMMIAAEAMAKVEDELLARRAGDAERKRRQRSRDASRDCHGTVTGQSTDTPSPLSPLFPSPDPNPKTPLNPPTPAAVSAGARDFESRCREVFGSEPIVGAPDFSPITGLIAEGVVTEADVLAGCRAAMADPTFRPTYWRQIVGWARRANQERLGKAPKQVRPRDAPQSNKPDDAAWRLVMRRWVTEGIWHQAFGPPGGADCPAHIKAEFERAA